jgi:hypothetical protein
MIAKLNSKAAKKQTVITPFLSGKIGEVGSLASLRIRLVETYPALDIEYSAFLSTRVL